MRECRQATGRRGNRSRVSGAIAPDTRDKDGEGKTKTGQNRRREGRAGPRPKQKKSLGLMNGQTSNAKN